MILITARDTGLSSPRKGTAAPPALPGVFTYAESKWAIRSRPSARHNVKFHGARAGLAQACNTTRATLSVKPHSRHPLSQRCVCITWQLFTSCGHIGLPPHITATPAGRCAVNDCGLIPAWKGSAHLMSPEAFPAQLKQMVTKDPSVLITKQVALNMWFSIHFKKAVLIHS